MQSTITEGRLAPMLVGMSATRIARSPAVLVSLGLGSCIGIALYDPSTRIGGMAHIMLPYRNEAKDQSNPAKFADSALELMVSQMGAKGVRPRNVHAKIFGGANMFRNLHGSPTIGERNIVTVRQELERHKIRLVAEDIGGYAGRSISFDLHDGSVIVRFVHGEQVIY